MKVLLIDNGTKLLKELEALTQPSEVTHTWREFTDSDIENADLIVLSGNSVMKFVGNETEYARELAMIATTSKPILGICFGCELISVAFGGTLRHLTKGHAGIRKINLRDKSLLPHISPVQVYEHHSWITETIPENFEILADSSDGPEILKHKTKPIYGLQFHPEHFVDKTDGKALFVEIIRRLAV